MKFGATDVNVVEFSLKLLNVLINVLDSILLLHFQES